MANPKFETYFLPSFPPPIKALEGRLQRESIGFENKWIPARARSAGLAGMTAVYATNLRDTTPAHARAGLTTLTHGLPAARRMILSAIACLRRLIVPAVQPDMCGVITTFGNSWNGYLKGRMAG